MGPSIILLSLSAVIIVSHVRGELIRQCTCSEISQCRQRLLSFVKPCADRCEGHAYKANADYQRLKNCFLQREPQILQTIHCTENAFYNACAQQPGKFVEKRYLESLEISGLDEINRQLGPQLAQQVRPLLAIGRRFTKCVHGCIDRSSRYCAGRLNCGLDLPSDSVLVQTAKRCAISSGFTTPAVQQFCNCGVAAGLKELRDVCPRLQIS